MSFLNWKNKLTNWKACVAQVKEFVASSEISKVSTPPSTPSTPAEEWQTPKSARKHVSWAPTPAIPVHNRFSALESHATNNDVIAIPDDDSHQRRPLPNHQPPPPPKPQSNFHPNQRPENQTLPPRSMSNNSSSTAKSTIDSSLPSILIAGDSIIKQVTSYQIRENLRKHDRQIRAKVNVKPFLGAQTRSMPLYLDALFQEIDKPDYVLAHVGTNDIRAGRSIENIKEDFKSLHNYLKDKGIHMIVSLLTCRSDDCQDKVSPINRMLIELSSEMGIGYSGNENIHNEHLNPSGYHLHRGGSEVLANNFSNTINTIFQLYKCWLNDSALPNNESEPAPNGIENVMNLNEIHTQNNAESMLNDIEKFMIFRAKHLGNPLNSYYNINSLLRKKFF